MEYLRKLKRDTWSFKFKAHTRKKYIKIEIIKIMSETDKIIAPEAAGKINAALKDEKVSNQDVKRETPK
jgi:hypothetical protein